MSVAHAEFGLSKFTYLGRNKAFLELLGSSLSRPVRVAALLGSGPVEPFEVATLRPFERARIYAFDNEPVICQAVEEAKQRGDLNLKLLAGVCRAEDEPNELLADRARIRARLAEGSCNGIGLSRETSESSALLRIGDLRIRERIVSECVDLRETLPRILEEADVVFEGCMLVNWLKTQRDAPFVRVVLWRIASVLQPNALFGSTASYGQFKGSSGNDVLSDGIEAGLHPVGGILTRWSVQPFGEVTSQFGLVFCKSPKPTSMTATWIDLAIKSCSKTGIQYSVVEGDLGRMWELIREKVVISFGCLDPHVYRIVFVDEAEILGVCGQQSRGFEVVSAT